MKNHAYTLLKSSLLVLLLFDSGPAWAQVTVSGVHAPEAEPPREYALENVEIGLARTACLVSCPVYQVQVSGDGTVLYEGRRNVRITGTQESVISTSAVLDILRQMYRIRFFSMEDSYQRALGLMESDGTITVAEEIISDLSSTILTIRIGDYEKRVEHYYWGPPDLINLIELIYRESGGEQWVE